MGEYEFKGKNTNKKREFNNSKAPMEYRPYKKKYNNFEDMMEDFLKESKDKCKNIKSEFKSNGAKKKDALRKAKERNKEN